MRCQMLNCSGILKEKMVNFAKKGGRRDIRFCLVCTNQRCRAIHDDNGRALVVNNENQQLFLGADGKPTVFRRR